LSRRTGSFTHGNEKEGTLGVLLLLKVQAAKERWGFEKELKDR